jgi:glycosyltransferase involved in cell wall biosynthesis
MINNPKVSVTLMTYNQKDYIKQCIDSLVRQECSFKFEIIVGDDASTDGTSNIVREYASKYPDIIVPLIQEKNLGPHGNFLSIINLTKGEYIAHMDGDDYALPGKLQAQADFMDKTPDCNICFHRVSGLYIDGTISDDLIDYEKIKKGFTRSDILMYMAVAANSSKMYKKEIKNFELPDFNTLDFYANIEQIEDKKAYFVNNNIYGVYRIGASIAWFGIQLAIFLIWPFFIHSKFAKGHHKSWIKDDIIPSAMGTILFICLVTYIPIDFVNLNRMEIFIVLVGLGILLLTINSLSYKNIRNNIKGFLWKNAK